MKLLKIPVISQKRKYQSRTQKHQCKRKRKKRGVKKGGKFILYPMLTRIGLRKYHLYQGKFILMLTVRFIVFLYNIITEPVIFFTE